MLWIKEKIPLLRIYEEKQKFDSDIYEARIGKELWKVFILLVMACLFIEFILIKKIEGKSL